MFHAPQNLEKGGHGVSPCTMHHLKTVSPGFESVLFRTLFLNCRVSDKLSWSDGRRLKIFILSSADSVLTRLRKWILIYELSLFLFGVCNSGQFERRRVITPSLQKLTIAPI